MAKSKLMLLTEMTDIISSMRTILTEAKVLETSLAVPIGSELIPMNVVRKANKWIKHIQDTEFKAVQKVKALIPEEQWEGYKLFGGFDDHREVKMLREAQMVLRKAVTTRSRPDFFKKGYINGLIKKASKDKSKT